MLGMISILGKHVASLVKDGRVGAGLKTFLEQDYLLSGRHGHVPDT